jgi:glycosyltransferase involved in cell wall biosynthesis
MGMAAYRVYWPLGELNEQRDFENCIVVTERDLKSLIAHRRLDKIQGYDLYMLHRMMVPPEGAASLSRSLHEMGGKVVFETDDLVDDRHRDLGYGEWMKATVAECDAITVSTPALGKEMRGYGKPVFVLPNHLDARQFAKVSPAAERMLGKLVVGTVSGQTHWGDLLLVKDALKKIAQGYPEVTIACAGYRPPYFEDIEGLEWFAPVEFKMLPALYRQFDIVLCPLDAEDLFNHSKSAVGALQAMASARPIGKKMGGAVPVVSGDLPVYKRVVNHRHNGLVVKDGKWYEAIAQLIENTILRQKLAANGLKWVKNNRDISRTGPLWARAYRQILNLPRR